ncbi:TPA: hypothetical protein NGR38_004637 [Vibrio parahaemolyticus]|nr:hypothetical protein [Vibrio parahaemolyticus]HCE1510490.1 hypothetical protein [Vibrio parahaemolyticus]HCE2049376.1 hypothetical protein [Vibrio parahaemolyticus]
MDVISTFEPIDELDELDDSNLVRYLIISNNQHLLPSSITNPSRRVKSRRVDKVTKQDICMADLVFVIDDGFDEVAFCNLNRKLSYKHSQFRLAICLYQNHKNRWHPNVDSVFLTKNDVEQRSIIRALIESIELKGLICVDFADIYSVFCNMQRSFFYQGVSEGEYRVIGAIDNAIGKRTFDCKTALMILNAGLDFTLDEFEMAVNYFSMKMPEDTCCVFDHRTNPDCLYTERLEATIFINE